MNKFRWLTVLGVICIFAVIVVVATMTSSSSEYRELLSVLGVILGIIVIGLGEILYYLQNGGKK